MIPSELETDAYVFCKELLGYKFKLRFDERGFLCRYFGLDKDDNLKEECGFFMPWSMFNSIRHNVLQQQIFRGILNADREKRNKTS